MSRSPRTTSGTSCPGYYRRGRQRRPDRSDRGNKWQVALPAAGAGRVDVRRLIPIRAGHRHRPAMRRRASRCAFDGATGTFTIEPTDKIGRDFRAQGLLRYIGQRYLQFAHTGDLLHQGRGRQPGELPGLCGFRRDLRHRRTHARRRSRRRRSSSTTTSRTSRTGGPATPPGRTARARASSGP